MFEPAKFAAGDRVRSVRGGTVMTVEVVDPPIYHYRYRCRWVDAEGRHRNRSFHHDELERAPDGPSPRD